MSKSPLLVDQLRRRCPSEELSFSTTDELTALHNPLGQDRALEAIQFGVHMPHEGYNLFVTGSLGVGKHDLVERLLQSEVAAKPTPSDYCYVQNFLNPSQPNAILLPAGKGSAFKKDMMSLIEQLLETVPATFESDDYRNRIQEVQDEFQEHETAKMEKFAERAKAQGVAVLRTPMGFTLGPIKDGKIISPEEFDKLEQAEQEQIESLIESLNEELREILQEAPRVQGEQRERLQGINIEFAHVAVDPQIDWMNKRWKDFPDVLEYLQQVKNHVFDNVTNFVERKESNGPMPVDKNTLAKEFKEYSVNLLVDNTQTNGAPIIYEDNPTYQNLLGRIEHQSEMGSLFTNFTLIKPGALHKANGGYLIIDVRKLLSNPFSWEGLKRVLRARELRLEGLQDLLSLTTTTSLEPEPIPLNVKVILCGERMLYMLLKEYDPEFTQLFKVQADFNETLEWNAANAKVYAELIAKLIDREKLQAFTAAAVAEVIEQSARWVEDTQKLTLNLMRVTDLLREANFWSLQTASTVVDAKHVQTALAKRRYRHGQIREQMSENIRRDIYLIDTQNVVTGQANGLAVFRMGDELFGKPSRITATARPGNKGILDIERETDLGGAIHSKGVMILSSFLSNRFGQQPIALSASIAFEQSYGPVDGDSASAIELCVLLSAIADIPIKQWFAVTGSVNQHGQIQAIGGVNEKIEGFFEVCRERQMQQVPGVIIPQTNVQHLMLNKDIIDACSAGQFQIFSVSTIDELLELLTGQSAGALRDDGSYPDESVNGQVQKKLQQWYELFKSKPKSS